MNGVRRRAWWALFAFGVVIALFGIGDTMAGVAFDPAIPLGVTGLSLAELEAASPAAYRMIDFGTRAGGPTLALLGVLFSVIVFIPYREGRRWAWFAMWGLPIWALSSLVLGLIYGLAPDQPLPPPMVSGPVVAAIAAFALLIDAGRFFRPAERAQA